MDTTVPSGYAEMGASSKGSWASRSLERLCYVALFLSLVSSIHIGASGYNVPIAVFGLLAEASRRGRHVFALLFVIPVSWVLDILRLMQFNFHSWVTIGVISAVALCMVALVKLVMMLALYQLFSEMGGTWSLTNSSLPLDRRHSFSTDEVVVGVVPMPHRGHTARLDGQHPGVAGPRPESRGSEAALQARVISAPPFKRVAIVRYVVHKWEDGNVYRSTPRMAEQGDGLDDERRMFAELGGVKGLSRASGAERAMRGVATKPTSKPPSTGTSAEGGAGELLTAMAGRLRTLEAAQRSMRDALVAKDQQLIRMRRQLRAATAALADAGGDRQGAEAHAALEAENCRLKSQLAEMETFLNDYGLVWVGSSATGGEATPTAAGQGASAGIQPGGADNAAVVGRVRELNELAGGAGKRVVKRGGAARFEEAEKVKLTLFANGFMLRRGPFRLYDTDEAQAFFKDVLDGYFPFEMREHHPNGVVFDLVNKSGEQHTAGAGGESDARGDMPGKGRRLQDGPTAAGLAAHGGTHIAVDAPGQGGRFAASTPGVTAGGGGGGGDTMSADALVKALPPSVVRNGKVIAVRDGVAAMLRGALASDRPDIVLVQTPVARELASGHGSRPELGGTGGLDGSGELAPSIAPADVTTLQVKSDSGRQTLLLKFHFHDTVGDVYDYVDLHRTKDSAYVLRTAFPPAALTDRSVTLEEAGLVPNAVLRIAPHASQDGASDSKK